MLDVGRTHPATQKRQARPSQDTVRAEVWGPWPGRPQRTVQVGRDKTRTGRDVGLPLLEDVGSKWALLSLVTPVGDSSRMFRHPSTHLAGAGGPRPRHWAHDQQLTVTDAHGQTERS